MTTRKTASMVATLRASGEDFEWYPTTNAMIDIVVADARKVLGLKDPYGDKDREASSVLDIGAGDGRVLAMFRRTWPGATCFSIEKSTMLRAVQPDWVVPAGTDFREQDLMALRASVVFCNPPYSEFESWAARIIMEAFCAVLYLIIPQRWVDSPTIKQALASRSATAKVIKSTDFHRADRSARARVDIIRIVPGTLLLSSDDDDVAARPTRAEAQLDVLHGHAGEALDERLVRAGGAGARCSRMKPCLPACCASCSAACIAARPRARSTRTGTPRRRTPRPGRACARARRGRGAAGTCA